MKTFDRTGKHYSAQFQTKLIHQYIFSTMNLIGQGYSSKVYKGRINQNKSSEGSVAVKVICDSKLNDFKRQLLKNQIYCYSLVSHPNVLKCLDVYSTKNNHYIITEYCEGGSLLDSIRKSSIKKESMSKIVRQLISGLLELQRLGIVHRDIKSANLLLKDDQLKIADLGFACKIDQLKNGPQNVGTPAYMAPQVLLQNKYSFKSDIFAVGVVIYELVTGFKPWSASKQRELADKMKRLPRDVQNIQRGFRNLVTQCLQFQISRRAGPEELRLFMLQE